MKLNEQGSTLVLVLLLTLVFSVLGLGLMGNVINESARIDKTESTMQARHLAKNGLTYFEYAFNKYKNETDPASISFSDFFKKYKSWVIIGSSWSESLPEETKIRAEVKNGNEVRVYSQGTDKSTKITLVGYYDLNYDIDIEEATVDLVDFNREDTIPLNFSKKDIVSLNLFLLNLDLINLTGSSKAFHPVPNDEIIGVGLLGPILNFSIGDGDRFHTVENYPVFATREGAIIGLDIWNKMPFALLPLDIIKLKVEANEETNVLFNGSFTAFELFGMKANGYRDIDFLKFAVLGNALIQQDRKGFGLGKDTSNRRRFAFKEGLFVKKSLTIGGVQIGRKTPATEKNDYSRLMLRGDMVTQENAIIEDVDLVVGDHPDNEENLHTKAKALRVYSHGDAMIRNSCIRSNSDYAFGLFTKKKLVIKANELEDEHDRAVCNEYEGVFYAEEGIEIYTNDIPMTIKGGLIGDVWVDNPEYLTIIDDSSYEQRVLISHIELTKKGQKFMD